MVPSFGKMVECCYCEGKANSYGICEDCLQAIRNYQMALVKRNDDVSRPFEDNIVGMVEVECETFDNWGESMGVKDLTLPVYDFMHLAANDDYSPDAPDSELRTVELKFAKYEETDDLSLEEVISWVYEELRDDLYNYTYVFKNFYYCFKVRGSRKSKGKTEAEIHAKRLLDLYKK